jgi:hypothetical protein
MDYLLLPLNGLTQVNILVTIAVTAIVTRILACVRPFRRCGIRILFIIKKTKNKQNKLKQKNTKKTCKNMDAKL